MSPRNRGDRYANRKQRDKPKGTQIRRDRDDPTNIKSEAAGIFPRNNSPKGTEGGASTPKGQGQTERDDVTHEKATGPNI